MDYRKMNEKKQIRSVNGGVGFSKLVEVIKFLEDIYSNDITKIDTTNHVELYKRIGHIEVINSLKTRLREEVKNA